MTTRRSSLGFSSGSTPFLTVRSLQGYLKKDVTTNQAKISSTVCDFIFENGLFLMIAVLVAAPCAQMLDKLLNLRVRPELHNISQAQTINRKKKIANKTGNPVRLFTRTRNLLVHIQKFNEKNCVKIANHVMH